jgi:hypothetical protein
MHHNSNRLGAFETVVHIISTTTMIRLTADSCQYFNANLFHAVAVAVTEFTLSSEELSFCFCQGPLLVFFLWTASAPFHQAAYVCVALQIGFSCVTFHLYLGPLVDLKAALLFLPFVYGLMGSELKKGAACNRTLYLVSRCSVVSHMIVL